MSTARGLLSRCRKFRSPASAEGFDFLALPFLQTRRQLRDYFRRGDAIVDIAEQGADAPDAFDQWTGWIEQLQRVAVFLGDKAKTMHGVGRRFRRGGLVPAFKKILREAGESVLRHFWRRVLRGEVWIRPLLQPRDENARGFLAARFELRLKPVAMRDVPAKEKFVGDVAVADLPGRGQDLLQTPSGLAQILSREAGLPGGDRLREAADGDPDVVDGGRVAGFESVAYLDPEPPRQAACLLGCGSGHDGHRYIIVTF